MTDNFAEQIKRLESLERRTDEWDEDQRAVLLELRGLSDALQKQAWQRVMARMQDDAALRAMMRELAADPLIYAVWRRFGLLKASLDERIEQALLPVRPLLHAHGGDVEIVEIQLPDTVLVRMTGACEGCPASAITLTAGVKRAIRNACPEIRVIRDVTDGDSAQVPEDIVSPFAAQTE